MLLLFCLAFVILSTLLLSHSPTLLSSLAHTHTYTQHIIDSNSVWVRCIVKYLRYMYIGNIYIAELSSLIRTIQFWLIRSVSVFYTVADICLAYYCCWCFCYNYCILLCIFFSPFESLINKLLQQIYRTKKKPSKDCMRSDYLSYERRNRELTNRKVMYNYEGTILFIFDYTVINQKSDLLLRGQMRKICCTLEIWFK